MGRGYYRSRSYNPQAIEHVEAYHRLERKLGVILKDIREIFFSLRGPALNNFLTIYGQKHGSKAQDYATETIPLWRNGTRKMSGIVAERLMNLIPQFLSTTQRYELVEKLCNHHIKQKHVQTKIESETYERDIQILKKTINSFKNQNILQFIPEDIVETINWLSDDDIVASRAIIAKINQARSAQITQLAEIELTKISKAMLNKELASARHCIKLPYAQIHVEIIKPPGVIKKLFRSLFGE